MGLITEILGIGRAAREVAEVFIPNRSENQRYEHEEHEAALRQYGREYAQVQAGWFNQLVNGLNRLPRPVLALGTVGLFGFAMADPAAFAERMAGLQTIPRELWWLLGAIVSFYFGARELHYQRGQKRGWLRKLRGRNSDPQSENPAPDTKDNPAVSDWQRANR